MVTELFFRSRELNISIVFITQSYFKLPKDVRLSSTHFSIMKVSNKRELQQIALNHSSEIDFKNFMKIYKKLVFETLKYKTMTIEDQIRDEKLQYDINKEAAKRQL